MALSGSLNFLSASITGSKNIVVDFVGLNTLVVDPVSGTLNHLGYPDNGEPSGTLSYYNLSIQPINTLPSLSGSNQLNSLLLNRNGPYQHPMWKQWRGAEHPISRIQRLGNTMSIDVNDPDPVAREIRKRAYRAELEELNFPAVEKADIKKIDNYFRQKNNAITNLSDLGELSTNYRVSNIQQYYEPSVTKNYNPFIYSLDGGTIKVRASLLSQMSFFENEALNNSLKLSGPNPNTGSVEFKKPGQQHYEILSKALALGGSGFIYSQTIFPKSINTFRNFKAEKPSYEEESGLGDNGYDRIENRRFWKESQPALASDISSDGNSRIRTNNSALNSQEAMQHMYSSNWSKATNWIFTSSVGYMKRKYRLFSDLSPMHGDRGLNQFWNFTYNFIEGGIIATDGIAAGLDFIQTPGTNVPTGAFCTLESYQPYPIALLSSWPLDPRPDIYDKPIYLTSSIGAKGLQIGLTPHRMKEMSLGGHAPIVTNSPVFTGSLVPMTTLQGLTAGTTSGHCSGTYYGHTASYAQVEAIQTGTAGELVYSTKPTMFFHPTGSITNRGTLYRTPYLNTKFLCEVRGYRHQTASMQYNRHTFPYNTPFYATQKIRGRGPFYDSYAEFSKDVENIGKDYSIIPEYKISDNLEYYFDNHFKNSMSDPLYDEKTIKDNKKFYSSVSENTKLIKRVFNLNPEPLTTKINFLKIDGAFVTASAGVDSLHGSSPSPDSFEFVPLTLKTRAAQLKKETIHYSQDSGSVLFSEAFSHTDDISGFSHITSKIKEFDNSLETVPSRIRFTVHALKKLLPYKNFYPVTKTVDIGNKFKKFIMPQIRTDISMPISGGGPPFAHNSNNILWQSPNEATAYGPAPVGIVGHEDDDFKASAAKVTRQLPGMLQTFLEPFFAPGILYNSIKSGIAVDYPVYRGNKPVYFCPEIFFSGSVGPDAASIYSPISSPALTGRSDVLSHSDNNFLNFASSSFNYGGFYMMGAMRGIPAILGSAPSTRVPFEAIYNTSIIKQLFSGAKKKLYLTTDFLDLDVNRPVPLAKTFLPVLDNVSLDGQTGSHPGLAFTDTGPVGVLKTSTTANKKDKDIYESSINNFLCETMNFFLKDQGAPGVKMPIIASQPKKKEDVFLNSKQAHHMEVSLEMGRDQVMCEGPRRSGMGSGSLVQNLWAQPDMDTTIRGYLYGPPIEVVRMSGSTTISQGFRPIKAFDSRFGKKDTADVEKIEPCVANHRVLSDGQYSELASPHELETYFGANLQDPAYQAFTPPYFYGKSSIVLTVNTDSDINTWSEVFEQTKEDSFYMEEYITGSNSAALCRTLPGTSSISGHFGTRMKIESSVDIFNKVPITDLRQGQNETKFVWYVAPKWVCPVLDFSSSVSHVEEYYTSKEDNTTKITNSTVTNTYHNNTTGKGLWGGYGADPYDYVNYNKAHSDLPEAEKGLFLKIGMPGLDESTSPEAASYVTGLESDTGFFTKKETSVSSKELTSSLGVELGFPSNKASEEISFKIGQFASEKLISEAIVIIPYFDRPITLVGVNSAIESKKNSGVANANIFPADELYATREIIPGKHFLPIHKMLFENLLSMKLASERDTPTALIPSEEGKKPEYIGFESEDSYNAATNTDIYKMIETLMGAEENNVAGYDLPPELDFINYNVNPFQMIVVPIDHVLKKQELIDIYQGVSPDSSLKFTKDSTYVEVNPNSGLTSNYSWMPIIKANTESGGLVTNLGTIGAQNFLNPLFLNNEALLSKVDKKKKGNLWLKNSEDFYKNLKFMTFKIKQKAIKNYGNYRSKQIQRVVENKARLALKVEPADYNKIIIPTIAVPGSNPQANQKIVSDSFGSNWPYDDFSLVEMVKIDIDLEVT